MIKKIMMIIGCIVSLIYYSTILIHLYLKCTLMIKVSLLWIFILILGTLFIAPILLIIIMILYFTITEKEED